MGNPMRKRRQTVLRLMTGKKRGSQMIEASLAYPIIILFSVMMLCTSVYFFNCTAEAADAERLVRRTADNEAGTILWAEDKDAGEPSSLMISGVRNGYFAEKKVELKTVFAPGIRGLFYQNTYQIRRSVVNECKTGWNRDLLAEVIG